jgi:Ser/Thr protein kinase RdoA (MazF antagonist)
VKRFPLETAAVALGRWRFDPGTLEHLATSGNDVYRFAQDGTPRILRLTDVGYRSVAHQRAEMAFLVHLERYGVRVAAPVRSREGHLLEAFDGFSSCVLTWAPGDRVEAATASDPVAFVRAWGRHLGEIHAAAVDYDGPPRWQWWEEVFLTDALALIPAGDAAARREIDEVIAHLRALPPDRETYGMIHHDFGPQNFHVAPALGITSFDYGNACHHFFLMDVVVSLSVLRRLPNRERLREALLEGYREVRAIPESIWAERRWFARLRFAYVYLSRLMMFGPNPTAEEQQALAMMRGWLGGGGDWP